MDKSGVEPEGQTEKGAYLERAQPAFTIIGLSVSSLLVYLISDSSTASEAWEKLPTPFERHTVANKLLLKKRYFRIVMEEGSSINHHIKRMKELTNKLAAVKAPVAPQDQVVTMLGSLPSSYNNIVTAL